ncbi:MAG: tetratricopeptide repeat protein [Terracidiphilus sp.]|jgi:Tfp pilus assembly protein PilF
MLVKAFTFVLGLFVATVSGIAQVRSACSGPVRLQREIHDHPSAKTWATLGGWFGEQKQFSCAIPAFQAALRFEPRSASLHYFYGLTLLSENQPVNALPELRRAIELDRNQLQARLLLGVVLHQLGRPREAEEAWEAALLVDPSSVVALDWLAKSRISEGQFMAAIDLLATAPADNDLTMDLVLAYSGAHLLDKATEKLRAALTKEPGDLRLSDALATVYVQSRRYQDATDLLRTTRAAHPNDPATELLYLRVLVLQDDPAARPIARQYVAANPHNFDALYLSGILENNSQDYAAAVDHLRAAIALDPNHYDARLNLGIAFSSLKQNEAAREQLEKAVALDPTNAEGHFRFAQVLRALGQTAAAQEQLRLFQERQQATTNLALAQTKAGQAAQALSTGHPDQAVSLYREAIEAQPENASFEYDLAVALDFIKVPTPEDVIEERAALEKAVQLKPGFAAAENQLGYLTARSGETAAAEQHFLNALAAVPRYAEAANNLGTLLGQEGRETEAEVQFRSAVSANPRYIRAWINLAATLASQSRLPEAITAAENALKIDPQDPDALGLRKMLVSASNGNSSIPATTANPGSSADQVPR